MITHICVSLQDQQIAQLKALIDRRREELELSYSELARRADILPSHARIICVSGFKTLSHSIAKICAVLKIDLSAYELQPAPPGTDAKRIQEAALLLWDKEREGDAERVIALLENLARLRNLPRPPRADRRAPPRQIT